MNNKLSKIGAFIDKLPAEDLLGECQSTLLVTSMESMGAASWNGHNCSNDSPSCEQSTNKDQCTNYRGLCGDAVNVYTCIDSLDPAPEPAEPIPGINACHNIDPIT